MSDAEYTPLQGQYLAYIHQATLINGRPPSQQELQRFFSVTPPTVHQMILRLESAGLLERRPGVARGIRVRVDPERLPPLRPR